MDIEALRNENIRLRAMVAEMRADVQQLRHLEANGVDNWEGYTEIGEE